MMMNVKVKYNNILFVNTNLDVSTFHVKILFWNHYQATLHFLLFNPFSQLIVMNEAMHNNIIVKICSHNTINDEIQL